MKWVKAMNMNPDDRTFYTAQYQEASLKYLENEYSAKHRRMSIIQSENIPHCNIFLSANAC
jgi:hypothetical protein